MPFKGDMRLGGPHDNERTLNGTSSDFDSVPAYGTVISGPTDTSRYVNDFVGTPFFMPYSTTVYANGIGGTYSVETWGLQYLPAGWVTGIGYRTWSTMVDNLGTYNGGEDYFHYIEDGTGINQEGSTIGPYSRHANGTYIGSDLYNNYYWNGNGGWYTEPVTPSYPSQGTWLGSGSGDINFTTPYGPSPCTYVVGTYSYTNYADGNGGTYTEGGESYLPYGTVLGTCGDYTYYSNNSTEPKAYWYYYNGYVLGYTTQSTQTNWWTYGGSTGEYVVSEQRVNSFADGYGSSYAGQPYTWYTPYGTQIGGGSYTYEYVDIDGNMQSSTQYFNVLADGNGSYYTQDY